MSADTLGLRLPVESSRRTISSLNSLIQGLFHTPEWSGNYLDLDLQSFNPQSKRIAFDHETNTSQDLSRRSNESTTSASAASDVSESRSMWFNDSPKNSFVELVDDEASISISDSHSHSIESTPPALNGSLYFGSEIISSLLSGAHSRSSSISSVRSDLPPIFVPRDVDSSRSVQSSEADLSLSDCLDDELLCSPLDSFAAVCWDSAVKTDEYQAMVTEEKPLEEDVKTEATFDFYNPLQYDEYDDDDSMEDEYPSGMDILSIEYKPVTSEINQVAPWMHVPKKALSILNLPEDHTFLLKNYNQSSAGPYQRTPLVPAITGKCRKVMKSIKELSA